jgi:hypothetical protein
MKLTRGDRLRIARAQRFKSARVAATALNIAISTYGAHERAEAPGGRDYGPEDAKRYARRFGVTPEWLLMGIGEGPGEPPAFGPEAPDLDTGPTVEVIGYVGAGAETHFYDVRPGHLDEVPAPEGFTESTVAVEIRGDSLGPFLNRWLVFYDAVRRPMTPDLIGELCVVGLADQRVLIKQVQRGRSEGLFNLISATEKPIVDVAIEWAARVNSMARPGRR